MQYPFLNPELLGKDVSLLNQSIRRGIPSAVFGVSGAAKAHLVGALNTPFLYVVKDAVAAEEALKRLRDFYPDTVYLPAKDDVLLYKKAVSKNSVYKRLSALYAICSGVSHCVTTVEALLQPFPLTVTGLTLKKGECDLVQTQTALSQAGYVRVESVTGAGTFAVRGDILDVFPVGETTAYRVNFFGDEIERIKTLDISTGHSGEVAETVVLPPAVEFQIAEQDLPSILAQLKKESFSTRKTLSSESAARLSALESDVTVDVEAGKGEAASFLMPLLDAVTADITHFFPPETVVFLDECKLLSDAGALAEREFTERFSDLKKAGAAFGFTKWQQIPATELWQTLTKKTCVALQTVVSEVDFFRPQQLFSLKTGAIPAYYRNLASLASDLSAWRQNGYRVAIFTGNEKRAENLSAMLGEQGVGVKIRADITEDFRGVSIFPYPIGYGALYHETKFALIGEWDLFREVREAKRVKRKRNDFFSAPDVGEYAVHETHGVGVVKGTKKITTGEGTKDYVMLEYGGGDILYVPVEHMDSLSRYTGGDEKPKLSKIGGKEFERAKERARESVKKLAIDLKELYQKRFQRSGFRFSEDSDITAAFDADFPYELTADQAQSVKEITADMQSNKVMDRLLCGDVGYGKTEVAFRAAFRAVLDGKQVALLCPTTILSQQHYETAVRRFQNFPVRIAVLNRFRTEKEKAETLKALKEGQVDIVIGTHALLSKEIVFADLGLLILDEEQRFGVEHKEKIKAVKADVDTLTMSATPIPRTLHMSLSGIRDISTIETPIAERLPVQTYVIEETEALLRDAIIRELSRGGQTFVLYNRVESIDSFASKLREIVPEAKLSVAHGQMNERQLEDRILSFFQGKEDVLVSTTIIENGIDLPNANTLIVIDADRLGLSQLYQLKGRVGRGKRLAHAYFTFKRDKVLTDTAYRRLSAIMDFTELNSGYKIAMRDLEIRGAGNVLGAEQHGHMEKIGYELYAKLIKEELTGEPDVPVALDLRISAHLPDTYISAGTERMEAYKQIAEIRVAEDFIRVRDSLIDLYGAIPTEVENLLKIAVLKARAKKFSIAEMYIRGGEAGIVLTGVNALKDGRLQTAAEAYRGAVTLTFDRQPTFVFRLKSKNPEKYLALLSDFLKTAAKSLKKS